MAGGIWSVAIILVPMLLLAVIVWAFLRNRAASPGTTERAERGAVELREEIERGDPPPHS